MSENPILKAAFRDGDWHDSLCEQLWSIAEHKPSAANLKLALDATHCIAGVNDSHISLVDELIKGRRLTSWQLFFRLCTFDIAADRHEQLEARLVRHLSKGLGFRQRRALLRFPRVLEYLNQYHRDRLDDKLFKTAESARGLLARSVTIDKLLNELGVHDAGKRIALVGNGPSLQGQSLGAAIDDHDVIVRFNHAGISAEHEADIGGKTQLWIVSPGLNFANLSAVSNRCAVTGPDPWTRASRYWQQVALQAVTHIASFELLRWHSLVQTLSAPPSAGLLMIDSLRQAGVEANRMTTFGFSRLENLGTLNNSIAEESANHYRDDAVRSDRHNWTKEATLYRSWIDS